MNPTDKFKKIFYGASDNLLIQFVRYFFVGGFAFIVDFGLLYILTEYAGLHYLLSATLSFIAGLVVNYIRLFTDCIGTHYMFSKIVAAAMVYLWNFFARKYLVFK